MSMFDEASMRDIAATAIINGISAEQKELIIKKAVEGLLEPAKKDDYYNKDKRTKIEVLYDEAIYVASRTIVMEELQKPDVQEKIRGMVQQMLVKVLSPEEEDGKLLTNILSTAVHEALAKLSGYR